MEQVIGTVIQIVRETTDDIRRSKFRPVDERLIECPELQIAVVYANRDPAKSQSSEQVSYSCHDSRPNSMGTERIGCRNKARMRCGILESTAFECPVLKADTPFTN